LTVPSREFNFLHLLTLNKSPAYNKQAFNVLDNRSVEETKAAKTAMPSSAMMTDFIVFNNELEE
jgi:hypothetical protein